MWLNSGCLYLIWGKYCVQTGRSFMHSVRKYSRQNCFPLESHVFLYQPVSSSISLWTRPLDILTAGAPNQLTYNDFSAESYGFRLGGSWLSPHSPLLSRASRLKITNCDKVQPWQSLRTATRLLGGLAVFNFWSWATDLNELCALCHILVKCLEPTNGQQRQRLFCKRGLNRFFFPLSWI